MKFTKDFLLKPDLQALKGQSLGTKVKYFWRKGWIEIPEIMVFVVPTIISLCTATYLTYSHWGNANDMPKYFNSVTVFRPDHPMVKKIRTDDTLASQGVK